MTMSASNIQNIALNAAKVAGVQVLSVTVYALSSEEAEPLPVHWGRQDKNGVLLRALCLRSDYFSWKVMCEGMGVHLKSRWQERNDGKYDYEVYATEYNPGLRRAQIALIPIIWALAYLTMKQLGVL